jgi:hypothetical protein
MHKIKCSKKFIFGALYFGEFFMTSNNTVFASLFIALVGAAAIGCEKTSQKASSNTLQVASKNDEKVTCARFGRTSQAGDWVFSGCEENVNLKLCERSTQEEVFGNTLKSRFVEFIATSGTCSDTSIPLALSQAGLGNTKQDISAQVKSELPDSCTRYVRSNPSSNWTLDKCVEGVPYQACHKTKDNERAIFGNTSKALSVELLSIYKNSCSAAPKTLTEEEMNSSGVK